MPEAKPDSQDDAQEAGPAEAGTPPNGAEAAQPAPAEDTAAPEEQGAEAAPEDRVAELEAEVAQLKDQLLRALAETENVRRRAQRERADATKYAAAPVLKDILTVADNLGRAVESVPEGEVQGDERLETLLAGVKLTQKELASAFERHHVVKLEPLGERLDPHRHEAMFEVPDPKQPSGIVVQVVEPGYLLHDRLLRPARVGVSRGAPAAEPAEAPDEEAPPAGEATEPGSRIDTEV